MERLGCALGQPAGIPGGSSYSVQVLSEELSSLLTKETSDPYGCTGCALKTCIQAGEENGVSVGNRTSGRCLSGADRRCAEERGLAQDLGARSGPLRSPRGHELECMSSQWV